MISDNSNIIRVDISYSIWVKFFVLFYSILFTVIAKNMSWLQRSKKVSRESLISLSVKQTSGTWKDCFCVRPFTQQPSNCLAGGNRRKEPMMNYKVNSLWDEAVVSMAGGEDVEGCRGERSVSHWRVLLLYYSTCRRNPPTAMHTFRIRRACANLINKG